ISTAGGSPLCFATASASRNIWILHFTFCMSGPLTIINAVREVLSLVFSLHSSMSLS
ncbi:hypothetical protein BJX63DRAFT_409730, partial [Aspergillus granulosus]